MGIDQKILRQKIAEQRKRYGISSAQGDAGRTGVAPPHGQASGRTAGQGGRNSILQSMYAVPVLGYVLRMTTGLLNLPRIIQNLYLFYDQMHADISRLHAELAEAKSSFGQRLNDSASTVDFKAMADRQRVVEGKLAGLDAIVAQTGHNLKELQAVVLLWIEKERERALASANMQAPPIKGAVRRSGDIVRQIEAADANQVQMRTFIGPTAEGEAAHWGARLELLENLVADFSRHTALSKVVENKPFGPTEIVGDPSSALTFSLAANGASRIALFHATDDVPGFGLFEIVSGVTRFDLKSERAISEEDSQAIMFQLRRFIEDLEPTADSILIGPILESLSDSERWLALQWIARFAPKSVLLTLQFGASYWRGRSGRGPGREGQAVYSDSGARLARELTAIGFKVRKCAAGGSSASIPAGGAGFILARLSE